MSDGLRVMVYDNTDWASGLTQSWFAGGKLYRLFRSLDLVKAVTSWKETFEYLSSVEPDKKIDVLQFWGHGTSGRVFINKDPLGGFIVDPKHPLHDGLVALKERLHPGSLVWFRTCATFNGALGKQFAKDLANFLGCRVAAHTFLIGPFQAGLHSIGPGEEPGWDDSEGLDPKTGGLKQSWPFDDKVITCLHGHVPAGW